MDMESIVLVSYIIFKQFSLFNLIRSKEMRMSITAIYTYCYGLIAEFCVSFIVASIHSTFTKTTFSCQTINIVSFVLFHPSKMDYIVIIPIWNKNCFGLHSIWKFFCFDFLFRLCLPFCCIHQIQCVYFYGISFGER